MDSRAVTVVGIIVGLLLPLVIFSVPAAYYYPFEPTTPAYGVAHESTAAYESAGSEIDTDAAISVDELTPTQQQVFAEAKI